MVPVLFGSDSLGILCTMFYSIKVRFAKLVIVDRYFNSFVRYEFAQLLLVCSSWATRFSKVFFSLTRSWTYCKESLPVKSSKIMSLSRKSSFSFCS